MYRITINKTRIILNKICDYGVMESDRDIKLYITTSTQSEGEFIFTFIKDEEYGMDTFESTMKKLDSYFKEYEV